MAAFGLAAFLVLFAAVSARAASPTFTSVADAFSSQPSPTSTSGTVSYIKVQAGSGQVRNGYLKFTVSGLTAPVGRATLRLWTLTSDSVGFSVRSVADTSWSESTLNWQNAPSYSPTVTGSVGAFATGTWVSVDVTPLVSGNGTYSFALTTTDTVGLQVASKDGNASQRPQLVIDPAVAPTNTAAPTVSGTAQDGQTLSATSGTWSGFPAPAYAYQWRRCDSSGANCGDIAGATGLTYSLQPADVGSTIRIAVTGSNAGGSVVATSNQTAAVAPLPPNNTAAPGINGVAQAGQTLTADSGAWSGTPPISFGYQWQRCDASGNGCADVFSATGNTYGLTAVDVGSTIRVNVTATNSGGSVMASSAPVAPVAPAPSAPVNVGPPSLSGTLQDGGTVTAAAGSWNASPAPSYTYQWRQCDSGGNNCADIAGATSSTLTLGPANVGGTIVVVVTATNNAGSASASSAASDVVAAATPANTSVPTISGTPQAGQQLNASQGSWSGTGPLAYTYQWRDCDGTGCADIAGATGQSYTPTIADVGDGIAVAVTATNAVGSATAVSAVTGAVAPPPQPPSNTAPPTITGTPQDGQTLTASNGTWTGTQPISFTYQWRRCDPSGAPCSDIAGAGGQSYQLASADAGSTIRVVVTATNAVGPASATSDATATVASVGPQNTTAPSVSGSTQEGASLSANPGTWSGTAPFSYGYQWRQCDATGANCTDIAGATGSTYTVASADVGNTIAVTVMATNSVGSTSAASPAVGPITVAPIPPTNTTPPTVTGTPQEGKTLTATTGAWNGRPTPTLVTQWQRCDAAGECGDIPGATASTYRVTSNDVGSQIRVNVIATNTAGTASSPSSMTDIVIPATPVAPVSTADPTISGTPIDNQTLTADPGTWTGTPAPTLAYQWRRCDPHGVVCSDIFGATFKTYVASFFDVGSTLRVAVTATNSAGTATATSPTTPVVGEQTYQQMILRDNPRGFWRLDETSGTTAADLGSGRNPGTDFGGVTPGVPGALLEGDKAARFNGVDGKVQMGSPSNGSLDFATTDFTVEAWFKTTVNGDEAIVAKQAATPGPFWQITVTANPTYLGRVRAKISDGTTTRTAFGPAVRVDDGKWHFMAVRYVRNSGIKIFVDGLSSFTAGPLTADITNTANFRIGYAGGYPYFNGDIDEVAVYPSALPDAEVSAHYSGGIDTTSPAVTLTNLPDGTATNDTSPLLMGTGGTALSDAATTTVRVYSGTTATGTPLQTLLANVDSSGNWSVSAAQLSPGTYTAQATQTDSSGNIGTSTANTFTVTTDPVIAAAGDIACDPAYASYNGGNGTPSNCHEKYTSDLLVHQGLSSVLTLGDNQYDCGATAAFAQVYDPTWGRVKAITHPAPGNHEYHTSGSNGCDATGQAQGYFGYFGAAAGTPGQGWYSFDLGTWHIISLNSNCVAIGGCAAGSPEEQWLQQDLAAHPAQCTLAYWHHPRFTSDAIGNNTDMAAFWQDLYNAGADVVLNGHAHEYERFAPQDPSENADPARGIREFVVGTGGNSFSNFGAIQPNSEVRDRKTFGVLEMTLHPNGYDWRFVHELGKTFGDSGSGTCH